MIAGTSLGGTFGAGVAAPPDFFPGQGGVAGLVKTLAHEWPGVRSRVVDFDPTEVVEVIAANVVHEVFARERRAEVGYREGRRLALADGRNAAGMDAESRAASSSRASRWS